MPAKKKKRKKAVWPPEQRRLDPAQNIKQLLREIVDQQRHVEDEVSALMKLLSDLHDEHPEIWRALGINDYYEKLCNFW